MRSFITILFAVLLTLSFYANAETSAVVPLKTLAPHIANRMVVAAVEHCTSKGYKVSSSVVGRDGRLLALLRNPLSGPHTIRVSERKAYTAASLQAPTSQMQSRKDLSFAPDILLIVGGVPINVGGQFYGGIAVAGADPKIDEECALQGIKAVAEDLEFIE